jgi:hypothetical protein
VLPTQCSSQPTVSLYSANSQYGCLQPHSHYRLSFGRQSDLSAVLHSAWQHPPTLAVTSRARYGHGPLMVTQISVLISCWRPYRSWTWRQLWTALLFAERDGNCGWPCCSLNVTAIVDGSAVRWTWRQLWMALLFALLPIGLKLNDIRKKSV